MMFARNKWIYIKSPLPPFCYCVHCKHNPNETTKKKQNSRNHQYAMIYHTMCDDVRMYVRTINRAHTLLFIIFHQTKCAYNNKLNCKNTIWLPCFIIMFTSVFYTLNDSWHAFVFAPIYLLHLLSLLVLFYPRLLNWLQWYVLSLCCTLWVYVL